MAYKLEGSILEVCDCNVLCPCWVGEKPDNGTCQSALAYHFERGMIDGIDVSGLTFAVNVFIPETRSRAIGGPSSTLMSVPVRNRSWRS
jgi:hypothetical protein